MGRTQRPAPDGMLGVYGTIHAGAVVDCGCSFHRSEVAGPRPSGRRLRFFFCLLSAKSPLSLRNCAYNLGVVSRRVGGFLCAGMRCAYDYLTGTREPCSFCGDLCAMSHTNDSNEQRREAVVRCSMEWSRDAAEKVRDTIEKAFYAGLLGDNWTVRVQRQNGGKLRVWIDTENKTA